MKRFPLIPLLFAVLGASVAQAQIGISPLRVDMMPKQRMATFVVVNRGGTVATVEVAAYVWTQDKQSQLGELTVTKDVVAFPRVMKLAPGKSRTVRVGVRAKAQLHEKQYRIQFHELAVKDPNKVGAQINYDYQHRIPLFRLGTAEPVMGWDATTISVINNRPRVHIKNSGNRHVKFSSIKWIAKKGGQVVWDKNQVGWYVLPGKEIPLMMAKAINAAECDVDSVELVVAEDTLMPRTFGVMRNGRPAPNAIKLPDPEVKRYTFPWPGC